MLELIEPADSRSHGLPEHPDHARTGDDDVDQVRGDVHQDLARPHEKASQALRVGGRDRAGGQPRVDIAGQFGQYLAEGEVGISLSVQAVALTGGNHKIRMGVLRPSCEFPEQGGLPGAGFGSDETYLALPGEGEVEQSIQLRQFTFTSNECGLRGHRCPHRCHYIRRWARGSSRSRVTWPVMENAASCVVTLPFGGPRTSSARRSVNAPPPPDGRLDSSGRRRTSERPYRLHPSARTGHRPEPPAGGHRLP